MLEGRHALTQQLNICIDTGLMHWAIVDCNDFFTLPGADFPFSLFPSSREANLASIVPSGFFIIASYRHESVLKFGHTLPKPCSLLVKALIDGPLPVPAGGAFFLASWLKR